MGLLKNNNSSFFSYNGRKYSINLKRFKEECAGSPKELGSKEIEISQSYEPDDNGEMSLSAKVEHETTGYGNNQSYNIVYDLIKTLLMYLMEYEGENIEPTIGLTISINTLLNCGILEEITEK